MRPPNNAHAAAAEAAAAAAAAGTAGGLPGWWHTMTTKHVPAAHETMRQAVKHAQKQKWVMPVDVKVG